jgi:hypothetical protein
MKTQFMPNVEDAQYDTFAENLGQAYDLMPWAAIVVAVEDGYRGFESVDDHKTRGNQK